MSQTPNLEDTQLLSLAREAHRTMKRMQEKIENDLSAPCELEVFELLRQDAQTLYYLARVAGAKGCLDEACEDRR